MATQCKVNIKMMMMRVGLGWGSEEKEQKREGTLHQTLNPRVRVDGWRWPRHALPSHLCIDQNPLSLKIPLL